jgi:hypothetical protein
LIQFAAKYKLFTVIEFLMKAGVPCPPDIKRKLDRNNSRLMPSRRIKESVEEEVSVNNEPKPPVSSISKVSEGNLGDPRAII